MERAAVFTTKQLSQLEQPPGCSNDWVMGQQPLEIKEVKPCRKTQRILSPFFFFFVRGLY